MAFLFPPLAATMTQNRKAMMGPIVGVVVKAD